MLDFSVGVTIQQTFHKKRQTAQQNCLNKTQLFPRDTSKEEKD